MLYSLRFSDANAGSGSKSLGTHRPATIKAGQTLEIELNEAEAANFMRNEAYTLTVPESKDVAPPEPQPEPHKARKKKEK